MRKTSDSTTDRFAHVARTRPGRALVAAALAASMLLPFSGGPASVASAAPAVPGADLVRADCRTA
jgi:hypothetical protein